MPLSSPGSRISYTFVPTAMALGDECLDFQAAARWLLYSHETMDHLFFLGGGCGGRRRKGCNNFIEIKSNENLKGSA